MKERKSKKEEIPKGRNTNPDDQLHVSTFPPLSTDFRRNLRTILIYINCIIGQFTNQYIGQFTNQYQAFIENPIQTKEEASSNRPYQKKWWNAMISRLLWSKGHLYHTQT